MTAAQRVKDPTIIEGLPDGIPSMSIPNDESPFDRDSTRFADVPAPDDFKADPKDSHADTKLILKILEQQYVNLGGLVFLVSPRDAGIILRKSEQMTESWRALLDSDTALRRKMKKALSASGWGAVMAAHLPVALAIAGNHRDKFEHLIKRKTASSPE